MDFKTGNSGNKLQLAVLKTGVGCRQEGAYCQYLGAIAPKVYALVDDGYILEMLEPARYEHSLLVSITQHLETFIWSRPPLPDTLDSDWREELLKYGVKTPDWVTEGSPCLVHGDPTASNALRRGKELVLGDPRPPRNFIPQTRETDMGRVYQSYFGWESVAYGIPYTKFEEPWFMTNDYMNRRALFWCGAAVARIAHLERSRQSRAKILLWCEETRRKCHV